MVWLIFDGLPGDPARHFYLLFLPLIWIALRGGMKGAVVALGIVQIGVVLGMHTLGVDWLPALELQALVAALTLTGLFLGIMIDERAARRAESLRQTLRLAAAGEMAGAIAHEVNQPLTALSNYGQSALMMLGSGAGRAARATPCAACSPRPSAPRKWCAGCATSSAPARRASRPWPPRTSPRRPSASARQVIGERAIALEVRQRSRRCRRSTSTACRSSSCCAT